MHAEILQYVSGKFSRIKYTCKMAAAAGLIFGWTYFRA